MPLLRLPNRNEAAIIGLALLALLLASWTRRGEKISALEAQLAAKPRVEFRDRVVEKKVVVKGPTHVVTVVAKDGSKTTTVDRAGETVTSDKNRDTQRVETPICPAPYRAKTRYAGVALAPDAWDRPRLSLGLTFADRVDFGGYFDTRYSAFGLESRFRW